MVKSYEKVIQIDDNNEMLQGLCIKYMSSAYGKKTEITEDSLKHLLKKIRKGQNQGIFLFQDPDFEDSYMQIEIDKGLIFLQYVENPGTKEECSYSSFHLDYLDSDEESPMRCSDGQSIILMRYTMSNPQLAAKCVEYFVRTEKLCPEMAWLKGWRVWE